jgi:hypothetical protein
LTRGALKSLAGYALLAFEVLHLFGVFVFWGKDSHKCFIHFGYAIGGFIWGASLVLAKK